MAAQFKRRRVLVTLTAVLVLGALAGSVVLRASKNQGDAPGKSDPQVPLEFAAADLAQVEPKALTRWLPLSGTLHPVDQSTVKAKVSGEIRQVMVREGDAVRAGQVIARFDTADLDAKLTERIGALEASRAQLALAEKTRAQNQLLLKQNFISQNAYDSAES
ncbi:MAG TPA: biotin/lipoyl-binding protein, partial [Bradyrhizobium sp.]